ncbi:uncharacterized protein LOC142525912 [Primulina tabacum]|uniref:uncharacterized protein LOC142525912 n=1 Tax=Primulina tabacum TaxID=48773 RepID=UPI003F5934E5
MEELADLDKWWDHDLQAKSYMLDSTSNELQRRFQEAVNAADIYGYLQQLYGEQTRPLRHATVKELMRHHTLYCYSLPSSFDGFVVNFNMNKLEASLEELVNMLTSNEATIKKEKLVFFVGYPSGTKKRPQGKGKSVLVLLRQTNPT